MTPVPAKPVLVSADNAVQRPTREQALAAIAPRARDAQWTEHRYYWTLRYALA